DPAALTLINLPAFAAERVDLGALRRGVILDMTALLSLGTLGVTRAIIGALQNQGCRLYLFPDCLRWMRDQIGKLRIDLLPAYRERFKNLHHLLRSGSTSVSLVEKWTARALSSDAQSALGTTAVDADLAEANGAYYVDDFLDEARARHVPSLTTSGRV